MRSIFEGKVTQIEFLQVSASITECNFFGYKILQCCGTVVLDLEREHVVCLNTENESDLLRSADNKESRLTEYFI